MIVIVFFLANGTALILCTVTLWLIKLWYRYCVCNCFCVSPLQFFVIIIHDGFAHFITFSICMFITFEVTFNMRRGDAMYAGRFWTKIGRSYFLFWQAWEGHTCSPFQIHILVNIWTLKFWLQSHIWQRCHSSTFTRKSAYFGTKS